MLAAVGAAVACVLGVPAVAGATTLVTPGADGVLKITDGPEGTGVNAVTLRTGTVEPYPLYILKQAPSDFPDPDSLQLASATLGCVDGTPLLIVCDSAQVTRIGLDLGEGRDLVDTTGLTRLGTATADTPDTVVANLGPDDDVFLGGPMRESVSDGRGADRVATGGGSDTIIQPDSPDPATDDAGDLLDPGTGTDSISYATRRRNQGVTVTLDDHADDGAPGEHDFLWPGAATIDLRGTQYADALTGSAGADIIDGRGGADTIDGRGGDDTLTGGTGADTITGGSGVDAITADPPSAADDDAIHVEDGAADGKITCGRGADTVSADPDALDALLELAVGTQGSGCETITRLVVDLTPPALAWAFTPPATTDATAATFKWTADGLGGGTAPVTETCTLESGAVPCAAQAAQLSDLPVGTHTFTVHVADLAGNASDASYTWTITAPPAATPGPTATPLPSPATPPPATPQSAKLVRPAGGRVRLEPHDKVTLRFDCPSTCPAQTLRLRATGSGKTYLMAVKVARARTAGRLTVRVTVPGKLAARVRRAGRRGIKAALDSDAGTIARLRLYR